MTEISAATMSQKYRYSDKIDQARKLRIYFILWFTMSAILPVRLVQAEEARLTVEEAVWTSGINEQNHGAAYSQTAPVGPLYLWMKVKGSNWALQW
ncbi:MAG: hypothetical protein C4531_09480 [Desulfurivibrio sp.]|jgi:hypothetical protein|nr:MAG: hypothetical protein C4531_09480 [Desulfurivibrio sp.]